ncbi:class I SAM-dependent methyltransferase [Parafrankia sp. FMc6]|uniref:class I SAM-dependent methyltransferase n=1 Tax=Parafrankia soli TaxID=2599596 RepID=UPI0034D39D9F
MLRTPSSPKCFGDDEDRGVGSEKITHARGAAQHAGIDNVTWVRMRAEDLPGRLGAFRVVTFAQSFHWLDRPWTAAAVRRMLAPDGPCVFVHVTTHEGVPGDDAPHFRRPREAIASLVRDYLGPLRRGRRLLPQGTPSGEEDTLRAGPGSRGSPGWMWTAVLSSNVASTR